MIDVLIYLTSCWTPDGVEYMVIHLTKTTSASYRHPRPLSKVFYSSFQGTYCFFSVSLHLKDKKTSKKFGKPKTFILHLMKGKYAPAAKEYAKAMFINEN